MKLRQKLAVVLASAMVVTAVPVVTMAASTNNLTKETIKVAENTVTTANSLKINFKDNNGSDEVFYLQLTNAKWDDEAIKNFAPTGDVSYVKQNDTTVKVTVKAAALASDKVVTLPILAEVTGGDATVEIVSMGGNTTVSKGSYVFATTSEASVGVTVGTTIPTFYTTGEIADIVITESMADAFKNLGDKNTIELSIDNDGYKFVQGTGKVSFEYGFATTNDAAKVELKADGDILEITLPKDLKADGMGQIRISGIQVTTKDKAPATGDFTISVYGDKTETQTGVKVGEITSYGSKITVDEANKVEIKAGTTKNVKVTLAETERSSFVNGREVEFTLDKGYIMDQKVDANKKYDEKATLDAVKKAVKLTNTVEKQDLTITDVAIKDEKVVGFTATMVAGNEMDKIQIEMPIIGGIQESGDVTLTVAGRSMAEEVSAVITTIKEAFTVNTEAATLKVGLQGQKAGKVTLTETDKAMFKAGSEIVFTMPVEKGITLKEAPEVNVTAGDIQMGTPTITTNNDQTVTVKVPVKRASRTASTVEISNFGFTTDRTVAEGTFDVVLGGSALTGTAQTIELKDFLVIGTPNTEDLGANGLVKGTSTFVIGENKYTVNGVEKEMDARSYVQDPGYTMVPMRYVAEAFGVTGNNVLFSKGVTTIFAGNRTIQLTNNSDVAVVNGVQIKMATKVVIKDGRTYAPIGEVAQLLGVSKAWDNTTKTATFTNK